MENQMTARQVVDLVIDSLGKIEVRMIDIDRYGIPIARAIAWLNEICKVWDREAREAQEKPEITMEMVPEEQVPMEERK